MGDRARDQGDGRMDVRPLRTPQEFNAWARRFEAEAVLRRAKQARPGDVIAVGLTWLVVEEETRGSG